MKIVEADFGRLNQKNEKPMSRIMIYLIHISLRKQTPSLYGSATLIPKRIQIPASVKTYDDTRDPENHLKNF